MHPVRLLLLVSCTLALCGFAKKPQLSVRFHVEAVGNAGGSFTVAAKFANPPHQGFIESVPFVSEKNIVAIYPMMHPDGTLGCAFKLDLSGTFRLRTVSTDRRGASVVGFIATKTGTHQLVDLPIDKPITDGVIYIPRGLTQGEIQMMQKQFPLMKATKAAATPAITY
jgi:hypothetical protein